MSSDDSELPQGSAVSDPAQSEPSLVVDDGESVYRRATKDKATLDDAGRIVFSSTAFNDPLSKPSVDRALLRRSPEETKFDSTDGIIELVTFDIRKIHTVQITGAQEGAATNYGVDVIYRPIPADNEDGDPENKAHSQIETTPVMTISSRFKKLKEALAALATEKGWLIDPS